MSAPRRTDGLAVAALVVGIVSLVSIQFLGFLAIIFGAVSMSRIRNDPTLEGRGMAISGLVLGIVAMAIVIFIILLFVMMSVALGG